MYSCKQLDNIGNKDESVQSTGISVPKKIKPSSFYHIRKNKDQNEINITKNDKKNRSKLFLRFPFSWLKMAGNMSRNKYLVLIR